MAYLQSRSGIARSGVTYCGWVKPNFVVYIDGSPIASKAIRYESLKIVNALDSHTSTMTFTLRGVVPALGSDIKLTYSTPNVYEFAGHILQVKTATSRKGNAVDYQCTAVGYLWLLDRGVGGVGVWPNLVTGKYRCGVSTAVGDILSRFTSGGFRVGYIPSELGNIAMDFTMERPAAALTKIAAGVGAYWEVSPDRCVSMYRTYPETTPSVSNSSTVFDIEYDQDYTQTRVRSFCLGGGSTTTAAVAVGATSIPVADLTDFCSHRDTSFSGAVIIGNQILRTNSVSVRTGAGTIALADPVLYAISEGEAVSAVGFDGDSLAELALQAALGEANASSVQFVSEAGVAFDEAQDRASADMDLFSTALSAFAYTTLSREVRPGRLVTVNITTPFTVSGSLRIQQVEITARGVVTSSSVQFYRRVLTSPWRLTTANLLRGIPQS
jgi:hypothetical protein